jgi:hypothetical protein
LTSGLRPEAGERGRGEARGAWASSEKKEAWAEPKGTVTFLIYSNEFQISSNRFDQKVDLTSSQIPNKLCLERV